MNKTVIKQIIFSLISIAITLLTINIICVFIAGNKYLKLDLVNSTNFQNSYGWFTPNQNKRMLFPGLPKGYKLTINSLGLRDTGVEIDEKGLEKYKSKILTVGDSVTFGLFTDDEDSYPYILQNILKQHNNDAIVLNAGVGTSCVRDHFDYIKTRGIDLKPDIIILNFCGNDLEDLNREKPYYEELINNYPKKFEKTFKETAFYRSILSLYVKLKYKRWIAKAQDPHVRNILSKNLNDIDSVLYVAENYSAFEPVLNPFKNELKDSWIKYFSILKDTSDYLRERNIKLIFIIQPELVSVFDKTKGSHEDFLKGFLTANDIEYVDIVPILKKDRDNVLNYYNNPPADFHLGKKGYSIFAEEIYKIIKDDGLIHTFHNPTLNNINLDINSPEH